MNLAVWTNKEFWRLAKEERRKRLNGRGSGRKGRNKSARLEDSSSLSEGPCKVELKFTVVTLTSTIALCVTKSCRIDGQRKLLSFYIQIIFKYSNKKLVHYIPSSFLSTTGLSIHPSPFLPLVSLSVVDLLPHWVCFNTVLFQGKCSLRGILTLTGSDLFNFWCTQQWGQETIHSVSLSLSLCLCSQFSFLVSLARSSSAQFNLLCVTAMNVRWILPEHLNTTE